MTIHTEPRIAEEAALAEPQADIRKFIAETLDLDLDEVTATLGLHDVPEWSSLDHVTLMLALEDYLGLTIDGPMTVNLTSVAAIEDWLRQRSGSDADKTPAPKHDEDSAGGSETEPKVNRGLDGVFVDTSEITSIDGLKGELLIRGYSIEDLAECADVGEVAHLVLYGAKPTVWEHQRTNHRLISPPSLPEEVSNLVWRWADRHPAVVIRTVVSLLGDANPDSRVPSASAARNRGLDLAAWSAQILSSHLAARLGHGNPDSIDAPANPSPGEAGSRWPVAAHFLARCFGVEPDPIEAEALDLVWRLQIDHGSNASAFAARVTASAGTDVDAAVVTGFATFAGGLHGGAVQGVVEGLREIGEPENAAAWVAERRGSREPIMGYGHRVYRVADPRSRPLRAMALRLAEHRGDRWLLDTMAAVEQAMAPYERAGLGMNVDSYAAVLYHQLGFPDDYHTALYAVARSIGWVAHIAEQVEANVLIRPRLAYTGPAKRPWQASEHTTVESSVR